MDNQWDCVIVGGGAAGLSAALVLGRARRRTLLLDAGGQSNLAADAVGGLLGNDRRPPAQLYAAGREELGAYESVEVRDLEANAGEHRDPGFALSLADGDEVRSETVLLATGMEYRYPDLPGAREKWGHSVFHCPFCHGWEVRGKPLAVLGSDDGALHRVLLLTSWSDSVALLTDGAELDAEAAERLARAGVEVDARPVASLDGPGADLETVAFADGSERPLGGLLVGVTLHRRSDLPAELGAQAAPPTPMSTESVEVDMTMNAGVPGLYAAGDLATKMPSVPASMASGAGAAAAIVGALTGAI